MKSREEFQKILDSVFKRDDVRGKWETELDGMIAWLLGYAFVNVLKSDDEKSATRIVIGRDMRKGSPTMAAQLIEGIRAAGGTVDDLGMCSTEMIYYATGEQPDCYQGGAMVTASHNPPEYAGVKFVKSGAKPLDTDELQAFKNEAARLYELHLTGSLRGTEQGAFAERFVEKLLKVTGLSARQDNVDLKIVIEAGNGMGGMTFRPVAESLEKLLPGLKCVFSNETPDGSFPICTPNPLLEEYLDLLGNRVRKENADLGICFDGDADRAGFVDNAGQLIDASLVSIILFQMLSPLHPDCLHVMGNLNSSMRFTDFVEKYINSGKWNGQFVMTPVGHAKIKGLMRVEPYFNKKSHKSKILFASEHSGHYFYPDFFYADSGMTTALFMIRKARQVRAAGKMLSQDLELWRQGYLASGEINVEVDTDDTAIAKIKQVAEKYVTGTKRQWRGIVEGQVPGTHEVETFEDVNPYNPETLEALDLRIDSAENETPRWWFSVRKSGNEPKLRLNVESENKTHMQILRDELLSIIHA